MAEAQNRALRNGIRKVWAVARAVESGGLNALKRGQSVLRVLGGTMK
jgi:hypothetical protein